MKRRGLVLVGVFGLLSMLMSGCLIIDGNPNPPAGEGSLLVRWDFDGVASCPSDVDNVVVQIRGMADIVVDCRDGQRRIAPLAPGDYFVLLKGISGPAGAEVVTWSSVEKAITVADGLEAGIDISLDPN